MAAGWKACGEREGCAAWAVSGRCGDSAGCVGCGDSTGCGLCGEGRADWCGLWGERAEGRPGWMCGYMLDWKGPLWGGGCTTGPDITSCNRLQHKTDCYYIMLTNDTVDSDWLIWVSEWLIGCRYVQIYIIYIGGSQPHSWRTPSTAHFACLTPISSLWVSTH